MLFIEVFTCDWKRIITVRDIDAARRFVNDYEKVNNQRSLFYAVNVATGKIVKFNKIAGEWQES